MAEPYDGSRPYAVMINNIQVAMPQCGTSKADIIYEVLAEGGITRMMAIFSQLEGDTPIGSIRSLRPYYLSIARSYDAIMVHAGGSEGAYSDLSTSGWDHIDGVQGSNSGSYYYRVPERINSAGYEHSLFINMDDAVSYAEEMGCQFQHTDDQNYLSFTDQPLTGGTPAESVTVHFRTGGKPPPSLTTPPPSSTPAHNTAAIGPTATTVPRLPSAIFWFYLPRRRRSMTMAAWP